MIDAGVDVELDLLAARCRGLDLGQRLGRGELVQLGKVHDHRRSDVRELVDVLVDADAVVADGAVDIGPAARQERELAAEAVAQRPDLTRTSGMPSRRGQSGGDILHAPAPVELAVEIERSLPTFGAVVELDRRLDSPEQGGHENRVALIGQLVGMGPHGVVDAEDLLQQQQTRAPPCRRLAQIGSKRAAVRGRYGNPLALHAASPCDRLFGPSSAPYTLCERAGPDSYYWTRLASVRPAVLVDEVPAAVRAQRGTNVVVRVGARVAWRAVADLDEHHLAVGAVDEMVGVAAAGLESGRHAGP